MGREQRNRVLSGTRDVPRFAAALLVFCFVAAQTLFAVHVLDDAVHAGDEPCKICVGAASVATAATTPPAPHVAVLAATAQAVSEPHFAIIGRGVPLRPPSRAPPVRF